MRNTMVAVAQREVDRGGLAASCSGGRWADAHGGVAPDGRGLEPNVQQRG